METGEAREVGDEEGSERPGEGVESEEFKTKTRIRRSRKVEDQKTKKGWEDRRETPIKDGSERPKYR